MGQQQLMVIVMGIVVAMGATAMGLQAFQEGQRKANIDAMMDDAIIISGDIQVWRLQPEPLGGGMGTELDGFSLSSIKYEVNGENEYTTGNGTFTAFEQDGFIIVQGDNDEYDARVMITMNGHGSNCLKTRVTDTSDNTPADGSDHTTCTGI